MSLQIFDNNVLQPKMYSQISLFRDATACVHLWRIDSTVFTTDLRVGLPATVDAITLHPSFWPKFEQSNALASKRLHDRWQGRLRLQMYFKDSSVKNENI